MRDLKIAGGGAESLFDENAVPGYSSLAIHATEVKTLVHPYLIATHGRARTINSKESQ